MTQLNTYIDKNMYTVQHVPEDKKPLRVFRTCIVLNSKISCISTSFKSHIVAKKL